MEGCGDFVHCLEPDISVELFKCLEDPSDLVRVCSVSKSWRHFVIANGLSKQLCLRIFPELSAVTKIIEVKNTIDQVETSQGSSTNWEYQERDHRVYAFLARGLTSFVRKECISQAIRASSTDNFPVESIQNTLEPRDRIQHRASYWSSKGAINPEVPETLVYKLTANLCVITEIHLQPFQAYFQSGFPIYSSKAVRFRLGHSKSQVRFDSESRDQSADGHQTVDEFIWTYTSPEFPVAQENRLQKFKLPEPVLCIGGILQIELLGRTQTQDLDGLYYICVSHVQVMGRPLSPAFDVEINDPSGKFSLKYYPEADYWWTPRSPEPEAGDSSTFHTFTESVRLWEQMIINRLFGYGAVTDDEDDYEDEEHVA